MKNDMRVICETCGCHTIAPVHNNTTKRQIYCNPCKKCTIHRLLVERPTTVWIVGTNDIDDGLIIKGIYASQTKAVSVCDKMKEELIKELEEIMNFSTHESYSKLIAKQIEVLSKGGDWEDCQRPFGTPVMFSEKVE